MRRSVAVALAVAAALPLVASAQQTFRSGVDVVRVDALVTNGRKPVAGLTRADFELRDNGVPQTIDTAAIEALSLSVFLVLDTSGSVAGNKMQHLREAVDLIVQGLHGDDRAALVTFSHRVWLRTPLVSDLQGLRTRIEAAEEGGGTSLHDAVYAALATSDVEDSRSLLVVFSDGIDNISWMSAGVVERAARRANAVVYGVAVAAGSAYVKGQTRFLDALASATGGRVLRADTTGDLPRAFDEILREFRTRYVITYSPRGSDAPGWHRIDLRVTSRAAEVKARAGYQK
jgi:Ca-activated chloride channel family protein